MGSARDTSATDAGPVARLSHVVGSLPGTVFAVATGDGRLLSVADTTGHPFRCEGTQSVLDLVAERDQWWFASLLWSLPQRPIETRRLPLTLCDASQRSHPSETIVWYDAHADRFLLLACLADAPT